MKINKKKIILILSAIAITSSVYADNNKCMAAEKAYVDYSQLSAKWCETDSEALSQRTEYEINNAEKYCKRYTKRAKKMQKRMFKECEGL